MLYTMRKSVPGKTDSVDENYTDAVEDVGADVMDELEVMPAGSTITITVSEGEMG